MPRDWRDPDFTLPAGLDSPGAIQAFLDGIPYSADPFYRCPSRVVADGKAHCFDGALFAAAALRSLGAPPVIVEMLAEHDDSHMLAIFKHDGRWGAIAKSNFVGLRFREAVYTSLRELVMSYFEGYYNVDREKTLRGYTVPLSLTTFDRVRWMSRDEPMEAIARRLDEIRRVSVITPRMVACLSPVDQRSYEAGLLGVVAEGLYKPER